MVYAAFRSIGAYVPEKILTNEELSHMVDTSDEWITKRTGIKERHIAAKSEKNSDMGAKAAELALQRSGIAKEDIDLVICGTISPDYFCMPSTATIISDKIGIKGATAFDISAACTGFIYSLSIAKAFIESGMKKMFWLLVLKNFLLLQITVTVEPVFSSVTVLELLYFLQQQIKMKQLLTLTQVQTVSMQTCL